jgi:protein-disulfide isomerase
MNLPLALLALALAQAPASAGAPSAAPDVPGAAPAPVAAPATTAPAAAGPAAGTEPGAPAAATGELDWSRIPSTVGAESLTPAQKAVLAQVLDETFCYCGCPHTLLGCLTGHAGCAHAPRMAALAARMAGQGQQPPAIEKALTDYYASFDRPKRARLDLAAFGPPLGDPKAPITIVEFSDFKCPFCQQFRVKLQAFVERNQGRVKLYYKPFPLPNHPRAQEAAEAAEWARDQGIFWAFHDAVYENNKTLDDDSLAAIAARLGKDGDDLKKALAEKRYRQKVLDAQSEGRRAGLPGTPTLFFEGRRHVLPDLSDTILEFTLDDEEEWIRSGGWRD